jgi:hypothetical protein
MRLNMSFSLMAADCMAPPHAKFSGRMLNDSIPVARAVHGMAAQRAFAGDGIAYTVALAPRAL